MDQAIIQPGRDMATKSQSAWARWGALASLSLAAWGAGGCAGSLPPVASDGFHAAVPFHRPPAGATLAQRESLYVSNRATANAVGFQVGLVPMDTSLFSDHLIFSGAPDLAKSLRGSAFE